MVKVSGVYPKPSNPTIRSTDRPSMNTRTQGRIFTFNFVTRNGAFSTSILRNRVSVCLGASVYFLEFFMFSSRDGICGKWEREEGREKREKKRTER